MCFLKKKGYLKYFNHQPSLILFAGEKKRKTEGDKVQKFNAEKEMFLKELKSIKKTLENSYFNLERLFLDQMNIVKNFSNYVNYDVEGWSEF